MAWNVLGSGTFDKSSVSGNASIGVPVYDFFSGEITTTDNFTDNELVFGFVPAEIVLVNLSANPAAYQMPRHYGTNKGSGVIPPNDRVVIRGPKVTGLRIKSLNAASAATCGVAAS